MDSEENYAKKHDSGPRYWIIHEDSDAQAIHEFSSMSDRAAGIVAAAFLEDKLTRVIRRKFFIDDDDHKKSMKDLFRDGGGSLASFGGKIHFAFATGLLSEQAKSELLLISKIRNDFAHALPFSKFDESPIKDKCSNLKAVEKYCRESVHVLEAHMHGYRDWSKPLEPESIPVRGLQQMLADPRDRFLWTINIYCFVFGSAVDFIPEVAASPYL